MNWIKKSFVTALFTALLLSVHLNALELGVLSMGVVPYSDWTPDSEYADWSGGPGEVNRGGVNDRKRLRGFGGKLFDIEAAYMDNSAVSVYFSIVTSFPSLGVGSVNPDGSVRTIVPGDIGIHIGNDKNPYYEFGMRVGGPENAYIYKDPIWRMPDADLGYPKNGPSNFTGGTLFARPGGDGGPVLLYRDLGIMNHGFTTYEITGRFPLYDIGLHPGSPSEGAVINMHWTMSNGRDEINVIGDIDQPVPEPSTLMLLGLGLPAAAWFSRRKRGN